MKIQNVSPLGGLVVPLLGREVDFDAVIEVSAEEATQLLVQPRHWAPADEEAEELLKAAADPEPDVADATETDGEDSL